MRIHLGRIHMIRQAFPLLAFARSIQRPGSGARNSKRSAAVVGRLEPVVGR